MMLWILLGGLAAISAITVVGLAVDSGHYRPRSYPARNSCEHMSTLGIDIPATLLARAALIIGIPEPRRLVGRSHAVST
jgi:hypothetical protein